MGEPVNSYADDFAFGIDMETGRGFISSNRTDAEGTFTYDNIYSFIENAPITDPYVAVIKGCVTDKHTGEPLAGSTITLFDPEGKIYKTITTDETGCYTVTINRYHVYRVRAEKEDYDSDEKVSKTDLDEQRIDFELQRSREPLLPGTDLAKVLNIPIIHFDFDKSNIRPDARVELEKVLAVLEQYPTLRLAIRSHTDSRGSDSYNQRLSQRRARSTYDYLVGRGIASNRLTYEGLGERELLNNCSDGVPCSEAEHQRNRRSEFIVIE